MIDLVKVVNTLSNFSIFSLSTFLYRLYSFSWPLGLLSALNFYLSDQVLYAYHSLQGPLYTLSGTLLVLHNGLFTGIVERCSLNCCRVLRLILQQEVLGIYLLAIYCSLDETSLGLVACIELHHVSSLEDLISFGRRLFISWPAAN